MIVAALPGAGFVKDLIGGAAEAGFDAVATAMTEAADELFKTVITAWTRIPSGGATSTSTIDWVQGTALRPVTALVAVLAMIACATRVAWEVAWGGDGRGAQEGAKAMLRTVVVGGGGTALLVTAMALADEFSAWVLGAAGPSLNPTLLTGAQLAPGLGFTIGLLAIFASLIQIFLLLARSAMVVLLAGGWQLAAASSATETGAATFKKITGWLVAFVIYKPAAAVCYATAFKLGQGTAGASTADKTVAAVEGVILLFLAILALPALLRLVVPAAAAMGGPSVGGALAGTAAVATGAATLAAGGIGAGAGGAAASGGGGAAGGFGGGLASGAGGAGPSSAEGTGGSTGAGGGGAAPAGGASRAAGTAGSTEGAGERASGPDGAGSSRAPGSGAGGGAGAAPASSSAPAGADSAGPGQGAAPSGAGEPAGGGMGGAQAAGAVGAAGSAASGAIEGVVNDEQ